VSKRISYERQARVKITLTCVGTAETANLLLLEDRPTTRVVIVRHGQSSYNAEHQAAVMRQFDAKAVTMPVKVGAASVASLLLPPSIPLQREQNNQQRSSIV